MLLEIVVFTKSVLNFCEHIKDNRIQKQEF